MAISNEDAVGSSDLTSEIDGLRRTVTRRCDSGSLRDSQAQQSNQVPRLGQGEWLTQEEVPAAVRILVDRYGLGGKEQDDITCLSRLERFLRQIFRWRTYVSSKSDRSC